MAEVLGLHVCLLRAAFSSGGQGEIRVDWSGEVLSSSCAAISSFNLPGSVVRWVLPIITIFQMRKQVCSRFELVGFRAGLYTW